jgi:hypothetical protein
MPEDNTISFSNVDFIGGSDLAVMEGHGSYRSLIVGDLQSNGIFTKDMFVCNQSRHSQTIHLDGGSGDIIAGGSGTDGDLILKNNSGKNRIRLDANGANGWFGGNGEEGNIVLFPTIGDNNTIAQSTIHLDGGSSRIYLKSGPDKTSMCLDGKNSKFYFGGDLFVNKSNGENTIQIKAEDGDIVLKNADCAEDFDITVTEEVEPGTVMVINEGGGLRPSTEPYDKKVAGVISGGGNFKAGIVLDRQPGLSNRVPIALMGKVYCKVDAQYAPIKVGDLLTTSATPGHAMKATDPIEAFGSIIGKALSPLTAGQGLLPILVTLQ